MVLGQADRPLFERQLDRLDPHPPVGVEVLLLAGAAEHERARIGGVGEEVVHRPIAGAAPSGRAARRPSGAAVAAPRRAAPPPPGAPTPAAATARTPARSRGAPARPGTARSARPRRGRARPAAPAAARRARPCCAARRPTRADQVQLGLRHRALEPEQQPVVEIARRVDPVGVGDQRPRQRAQIQQLMPVRRASAPASRSRAPGSARPARARPRPPTP